MASVEKKSFCRVCGSACGIIVELDGQTVVKVRADEDHPVTAGYTCPKGRNLPNDHHREDRLEYPMIREGGVLRRVTWDEALDDLGAKLKSIIDRHGPRGVGLFTGGGGYLDASGHLSWQAFKNAIGTPSVYSDLTIDSVAKLVTSELVTGFPGLMSRADIARAKLVIFMGTNPVISHGHTSTLSSPTASLRSMRERGTEVWVIDPRKTETAQRADRYIGTRPSTDYAVLAYLVRELLIDGADREFLAAHTQGVDRLQAAVSRFTMEHASAVSGTDPQDLRDLLASVRKAGRLAVETGTGITMSRPGNVTVWLSWCLMLVTGSLDREGGAWFSPGNIMQLDKLDVPPAPENGWQAPGPESRPEMTAVGGEYPCAALPDEIVAGNLRAMVVFGGNIEVCLPETTRTYEALKQLEVMATFDVRYNRTTDASTHILPTKDQLERADMTYVTDGYFPVMSTQYTPAMIEPVGERKAYWWVLGQLGKRMGIDFFPGLDVDTATDDTVMAYILRDTELKFEELKESRHHLGPPVFGWVERYVQQHRVKAIYVVPDFGNPTGATLSLARREQLVHAQLVDPFDEVEVGTHVNGARDFGRSHRERSFQHGIELFQRRFFVNRHDARDGQSGAHRTAHELTAAHFHDFARIEPAHALGRRVQRVIHHQHLLDRARIGGQAPKRARLGGECDLAILLAQIKRLDAERIAHEPCAPVRAEQAERIHAAQPRERRGSRERDDGHVLRAARGVGVRPHPAPARRRQLHRRQL